MSISNKIDIKSIQIEDLNGYFASIGDKSYRVKQVMERLFTGTKSFYEMTNLPKKLREKLDNDFIITVPDIVSKMESVNDQVTKYLWKLADGLTIESVLMEYNHGSSICLSTQVGCRMGCIFCASGRLGLQRNLTASEMLNQVIFTQKDLSKKVSNIVLMGIGEPLDNFDNVIQFLKLIISPDGMNIGARHITLSTCGIIENIDKLADYGIQLTIAVSLHAPDDVTRRLLMPIAAKYKINELLASCSRYFNKTGRRITFEYALIDKINDGAVHAEKLALILKKTGSHLNIIKFNQNSNCDLKPSSKARVDSFIKILNKYGINFTMRRNLGKNIAASCGMLRQQYME